jgi:hypothetical protein
LLEAYGISNCNAVSCSLVSGDIFLEISYSGIIDFPAEVSPAYANRTYSILILVKRRNLMELKFRHEFGQAEQAG